MVGGRYPDVLPGGDESSLAVDMRAAAAGRKYARGQGTLPPWHEDRDTSGDYVTGACRIIMLYAREGHSIASLDDWTVDEILTKADHLCRYPQRN